MVSVEKMWKSLRETLRRSEEKLYTVTKKNYINNRKMWKAESFSQFMNIFCGQIYTRKNSNFNLLNSSFTQFPQALLLLQLTI